MSHSKRVQNKKKVKEGLEAPIIVIDEMSDFDMNLYLSTESELLKTGRQSNLVDNIQLKLYKELCAWPIQSSNDEFAKKT